jgi:hypothetical protein
VSARAGACWRCTKRCTRLGKLRLRSPLMNSRPQGYSPMKLRKRARKLIGLMSGRRSGETAASKSGKKPFADSRTYWEERYTDGGNSGVGSYGKFADFKAEVLNAFVAENNIGTVIEFGCGDGNQLLLTNYPKYTGFDVSGTVVNACLDKFKDDDSKSFKRLELYGGETAELTLSLDVIFHLVEDNEYESHMCILFEAATRFVMIYSSNTDENHHNHKHMKHRKFTDWIEANATGWSLDRHVPNRYPWIGDYQQGSFADFYIYKKITP